MSSWLRENPQDIDENEQRRVVKTDNQYFDAQFNERAIILIKHQVR